MTTFLRLQLVDLLVIKISVAMKVIKLISLNLPDGGTYMSVRRLSKLRTFGKDFVVKSGLFMQNPDLI